MRSKIKKKLIRSFEIFEKRSFSETDPDRHFRANLIS